MHNKNILLQINKYSQTCLRDLLLKIYRLRPTSYFQQIINLLIRNHWIVRLEQTKKCCQKKNYVLRKLEMHYLQQQVNATNNHFVNLPLPKREQEIIQWKSSLMLQNFVGK